MVVEIIHVFDDRGDIGLIQNFLEFELLVCLPKLQIKLIASFDGTFQQLNPYLPAGFLADEDLPEVLEKNWYFDSASEHIFAKFKALLSRIYRNKLAPLTGLVE